jgi:uncharacterized protein YjbI with pentapeptide repeats
LGNSAIPSRVEEKTGTDYLNPHYRPGGYLTKTRQFQVGIVRVAGVLILGFGVANLSVAALMQRSNLEEFFHSLATNLGTELIGLAVTVLIIDSLYRQLQENQVKAKLIRDLSTTDNVSALKAVRELKENGWLSDGTLRGADLSTANLQGAHLVKAKLDGARLQGANFKGSILISVSMKGADLRNIDLDESIILDSNFSEVDLWAGKFNNSKLGKVNFEKSHLVGVSFKGAKIKDCNFQESRYGLSTRWPEAFDPKAVGAIDRGSWFGSLFELLEEGLLEMVEGDEELMRYVAENDEFFTDSNPETKED